MSESIPIDASNQQTELSRRIDQRIGLFLANTIIPPSQWTYCRQEIPPTITYILHLDGVEAGRLTFPYTLTNLEHLTDIATILSIRGRQAFREFSAPIIRDLEFWHKTIWLAKS